ncbi:MAG: hypothetical protein WC229_01000 [Candidatus Paceibacterota bacterium]|jgi:hypothetical protein
MEKNLKPKQYYYDLYDRHTVEICRRLVKNSQTKEDDKPLYCKGEKVPKEVMDILSNMILEMRLIFETGDRYMNKEEIIGKWISRDQEKDRFYESVQAPEGIHCLRCCSLMKVLDKDLWDVYEKPLRVLFMFDCPNKCLPRRAFYDNGEEWTFKADPCPKCGSHLHSKEEITEDKFITHYFCDSCDFTKIEELARTANKKDEPDPNFIADREKYCLSKEEGEKWSLEVVRLEGMKRLVDDWKERDKNKDQYDKIAQIKKLTILELEKLINPVLEKAGYIKLQLSNPEITKDFIVPFGVYDSKSDRPERHSEADLKKLLKKTLEGTNWRLMTEGISYRLGFLSGRLRGYEREEDLLKLVT